MPAINTTERLCSWIAAAITEACAGEEYQYDVTWDSAQSPTGTILLHKVVVSRRHPLLGQGPLLAQFQIDPLSMVEQRIKTTVTQAVQQLTQAHMKVLGQLKAGGITPN